MQQAIICITPSAVCKQGIGHAGYIQNSLNYTIKFCFSTLMFTNFNLTSNSQQVPYVDILILTEIELRIHRILHMLRKEFKEPRDQLRCQPLLLGTSFH